MPWVIASVKRVTEPAGAEGRITWSASSWASWMCSGMRKTDLWEPGTQQKPPWPGPASVRFQETTTNPVCRTFSGQW